MTEIEFGMVYTHEGQLCVVDFLPDTGALTNAEGKVSVAYLIDGSIVAFEDTVSEWVDPSELVAFERQEKRVDATILPFTRKKKSA